jgi:murein DD-endopeptidase MepM/ murein hydrolase activator NlpD
VSRSSTGQVLDRPATLRTTAGVRLPNRSRSAVSVASAAEPETEAPASRKRRRLPHPPGRRAPLWFAALVAGAVLAGLPSLFGGSPTAVTLGAAGYGIGADTQMSPTGELSDAGVHAGISQAEARRRLDELAASRAARAPKTVLPTHGVLTTCFCMRWGQMHYGIDLAAPLGTPIVAATDGVVLRAGPASGFGNAIYIQDVDGNVQVYGHMRYYSVHTGQIVHAGDRIARVGDEGQSTGPHLHFELRHGSMEGKAFDPQPWLAAHGIHV